jgi:hypothetical protein
MIYSFAVQDPDGAPLDLERTDVLAESLLAVRDGDARTTCTTPWS